MLNVLSSPEELNARFSYTIGHFGWVNDLCADSIIGSGVETDVASIRRTWANTWDNYVQHLFSVPACSREDFFACFIGRLQAAHACP